MATIPVINPLLYVADRSLQRGEHNRDQDQCAPHHIGYGSSSSSPDVGAKLLGSHGHKDGPETGPEP